MNDYKKIIAYNIAELRKAVPLTQAELAERLNYSDKAVSKWERGESIPDVSVLKEIADVFGVTVDYLLEEVHPLNAKMQSVPHQMKKNRLLVTMLSCSLVWFIATTVFVVLWLTVNLPGKWLAFVYAVPISAVVMIVFNSIWGKGRLNFPIISLLVWSLLACVYLTIGNYDDWPLFLLGIPAQAIILLWSGIKARFILERHRIEERREQQKQEENENAQ